METIINSLYVKTSGNPENQPIIFVHGFPYDHTMWQFQVEELEQNYYCVSYDIRGLGNSYVGDGQYTMEAFVWDLYSVMDQLELKNPILCGLSMGGYISLRAVEKEEKRFKALILCDSRSEADNNAGKLKRAYAINKINTEGLSAFVNDFVPGCFWNSTIENKPDLFNTILSQSKSYDPIGVKGSLIAMLSRTDTTEALKKFNLPTLILVGEHDSLTPPAIMKKMAKSIYGSKFVVVPTAGHMSPLENPDFVNNEIRDFIENL